METALMALGGVVLATLVGVVILYRGFVRRRSEVETTFAAIDVQLKKRWDLVPNVVETVRGYATEELEIFEDVMRARHGVEQAETGTRERFEYEQDLGAGVTRILAMAEEFPELVETEHFRHLQRSWGEVEAQLGASRRSFNAAITNWNDGVERFPGSLLAKLVGFQPADWFETPSGQRKASDVRL